MWLRKMLPILPTHVLFAYGFGNQIYGFSPEPNALVVVALTILLLFIASFAGENKFSDVFDCFLGVLQAMFAAISGMIDIGHDSLRFLVPIVLLICSAMLCYFRMKRSPLE